VRRCRDDAVVCVVLVFCAVVSPDMIRASGRRRRHRIGASTEAFQAVLPYQTTYAATKAFDLSFAEGLLRRKVKSQVRGACVRGFARALPGHTTIGVP